MTCVGNVGDGAVPELHSFKRVVARAVGDHARGTDEIVVLYNNGDGDFSDPRTETLPLSSMVGTSASHDIEMIIFDANNDGVMDIAVAETRKGAVLVAFGVPRPPASWLQSVGDEVPRVEEELTALGMPLDSGLTFGQLLSKVCGTLGTKAREVAQTMSDHGFGLPFQLAQFRARVENDAL